MLCSSVWSFIVIFLWLFSCNSEWNAVCSFFLLHAINFFSPAVSVPSWALTAVVVEISQACIFFLLNNSLNLPFAQMPFFFVHKMFNDTLFHRIQKKVHTTGMVQKKMIVCTLLSTHVVRILINDVWFATFVAHLFFFASVKKFRCLAYHLI